MLIVGAASKEITPPLGLELAGYPHYPRNNEGAHDPLCATCLYISNETQQVAIVTLDLLFFSKKHVAAVREIVFKECGIPKENIMISCSHTHSGPWAAGRLDIESLEAGKEQPKEYVAFLIDTISKLIINTKENSFPGYFLSGYAICGAESGIGGNRIIPGGPHDPRVGVMAVKDTDDNIKGILVNYALHPTFIHEWSNVCTADYPAYIRTQLTELCENAVVGFSQGASGNQSSRYYRQGESYDEAERVGRLLGKAAFSVIQKGDWQSDLTIATASDTIPFDIRDFGSEEEIEKRVKEDEARYKELYAKYGDSKNREEYYLWQNANLKLLGSEDRLGYVKMKKRGITLELITDEAPLEIHIIRLGDTCVVGVQGELFVEYAIYIKAMAGFKTVIFNELANGCMPGYMYTPEAVVLGGYESDTSMLSEKFGRNLVDKTIDTIYKIR